MMQSSPNSKRHNHEYSRYVRSLSHQLSLSVASVFLFFFSYSMRIIALNVLYALIGDDGRERRRHGRTQALRDRAATGLRGVQGAHVLVHSAQVRMARLRPGHAFAPGDGSPRT